MTSRPLYGAPAPGSGPLGAPCLRGWPARALLLTGLILAGPPAVTAQQQSPRTIMAADGDTTSRPIPLADRTAATRWPNPRRYADLRSRNDLQYESPGHRPVLSAWERFWLWFWHQIDELLSSPAGRTTLEWGWYAFLLAVTVWVALRLLKVDLTRAFGRAPRTAPGYATESAETPFTEDLTDRLAEAEAAGNYRLAVRLGYLLALRQLADRDLVRWVPDKTNQQYLRELPPGTLRDTFARLTRQFEVAWYGEVYPTAADYGAVRDTRAALNRSLGISTPDFQPAS